jgi:hypothetical protein
VGSVSMAINFSPLVAGRIRLRPELFCRKASAVECQRTDRAGSKRVASPATACSRQGANVPGQTTSGPVLPS